MDYNSEPDLLRVKNTSDPSKVASAIAHSIYEGHLPTIRVIGASATNQAIKAIAIAAGYIAPRGIRIACIPGFSTIESRDGSITAMTLEIVRH